MVAKDAGISVSVPFTPGRMGWSADGSVKWTATEVDLVSGSNAELRAVSGVYA
jgi:catalase (peroxidase I)